MRAHHSRSDRDTLDDWLADVVAASRDLVRHVVDRVDDLVADVRRDAAEVASRAVDLFDELCRDVDRDDSEAGEAAERDRSAGEPAAAARGDFSAADGR